jgi:transitional endoplasmic reticulum ATPase
LPPRAEPGQRFSFSADAQGQSGRVSAAHRREQGLSRAARVGLEVMQQRASDLLSCWVGESEKQIAAAFQAARAQGAMLVIDEADSLLCDRHGAARSLNSFVDAGSPDGGRGKVEQLVRC